MQLFHFRLRYKTLKGYNVKRKAGWDTHGLPVELGVEKELGISKDDIGDKISISEYNSACKKAVMKYTSEWEVLTESMGYWIDLSDPYITYKPKYMETVWWLIKNIFEKNLLYKGFTVLAPETSCSSYFMKASPAKPIFKGVLSPQIQDQKNPGPSRQKCNALLRRKFSISARIHGKEIKKYSSYFLKPCLEAHFLD